MEVVAGERACAIPFLYHLNFIVMLVISHGQYFTTFFFFFYSLITPCDNQCL